MSKHLCLGLIECENGGGSGGGVVPAPNVKVGVEFQTGRLRDGKVEYGYLMDWGMVASGLAEDKPHNLISMFGADVNSVMVDAGKCYVDGGDGRRCPLPYASDNTNPLYGAGFYITTDRTNIRVYYSASWAGSISPRNNHVYIMLTYTKTADPVLPNGAQAFIGADGWYIKDADGLHPWDEMN